jgi:Winged helix DNA-binding domain
MRHDAPMPSSRVLTGRALNRASLDRQGLLRRSAGSTTDMIERLVGLQAQTPHTAYIGLWSRLERFDPEGLSDLLVRRAVVRIALMRGTIHLVTAGDAVDLRPLVQPVFDRVQRSQFGRRLEGVDATELVGLGRAFVEAEPRTFKALGDHLLERWPDQDRMALEQGVRAGVPLVQVPPRGLWGRSGPIAHTSIEAWLGPDRPRPTMSVDAMVLRYLAAFGPAGIMDAQAWCGLTRLREVFDRLRPALAVFTDESGREVFDLPDSPRPDSDTPAPPRFLYDFENLLLSYADRSRVIPPGTDAWSWARDNEPVSTYLVDGVVSGAWKVQQERGSARLVLRPARPVPQDQMSALEGEGRSLLAFLAPEATRHELEVVRP